LPLTEMNQTKPWKTFCAFSTLKRQSGPFWW